MSVREWEEGREGEIMAKERLLRREETLNAALNVVHMNTSGLSLSQRKK